MMHQPTPGASFVQRAPRIRLCRSAGVAPLRGCGEAATGVGHFLQKDAVNNTKIENSSSRPSSMVIEQTQVWKSVRPW